MYEWEIKDYITIGGIMLTFVFGLWNLVVSKRNVRKTLYINTITAARIKYIDRVGSKFSSRFPKRIWANRNAVPRRTTCSLAAMLVHECVHALSYHNKKYNFSYDDDPPSRNQGTAPY
jgi:hypothetical protein